MASNVRASDAAATVVSHGTAAGEPTVDSPGPALPAEFATNTPASEAPRNATSVGPISALLSDPIE